MNGTKYFFKLDRAGFAAHLIQAVDDWHDREKSSLGYLADGSTNDFGGRIAINLYSGRSELSSEASGIYWSYLPDDKKPDYRAAMGDVIDHYVKSEEPKKAKKINDMIYLIGLTRAEESLPALATVYEKVPESGPLVLSALKGFPSSRIVEETAQKIIDLRDTDKKWTVDELEVLMAASPAKAAEALKANMPKLTKWHNSVSEEFSAERMKWAFKLIESLGSANVDKIERQAISARPEDTWFYDAFAAREKSQSVGRA